MTKSETSQLWIEAGYRLLANEGPSGVQVEKIARQLGRNKSGFYYHFGDRDLFFSDLFQYHFQNIDEFCKAVETSQHFVPDYLNCLLTFRESVFVQMQLQRNRQIKIYKDTFYRVTSKTDRAVLPLWASYVGIPQHNALAMDLWNILRDVFFNRINPANLSYEFIYNLVDEFYHIVEKLKQLAQIAETTRVIPIRKPVQPKQNPRRSRNFPD